MSNHEHRNMAYLLEDVMKNKFNRAFYQEDLWKYVENKKTETYERCETLGICSLLVLQYK